MPDAVCVYDHALSPVVPKRAYRTVKVINSSSPVGEMVGSPAQFGPDMGPGYLLSGTVVLGDPFNGCSSLVDPDSTAFQNKIVIIQRGGCSFMSKVGESMLHVYQDIRR